MRFAAVSALALSLLVVGCSNDKKPADTAKNGGSALDVAGNTTGAPAPGPAMTPAPAPAPIPVAPVVTDTPPAPAAAAAAPSTISGKSYVVKKGDTLMKISRARYGDASHVKAILAANPDVKNPNDIKVGQKLALP